MIRARISMLIEPEICNETAKAHYCNIVIVDMGFTISLKK